MQVKNTFIAALLTALAALCVAFPLRANETQGIRTWTYSWSSPRIASAVWGIAAGDMDGDGASEIILIEDAALEIAHIAGSALETFARMRLPAYTQGLRVFTMDVDGDGRDEAIVSAASHGSPSSLIVKLDEDRLTPVVVNQPWHLRVMTMGGAPQLIGQRSTPDDFFTGKIYPLTLERGALKQGDPLALPRWADIFNFAFVELPDDERNLIALKGFEPLQAYELRGTKWKKFWQSAHRFGGTMRHVVLRERPPLQDLPVFDVMVDREPLVLPAYQGAPALVAAQHDLPVRNIIGARPAISSGHLTLMRYDASLGFMETLATRELPSYIADYCIDTHAGNGAKRLLAVIQSDVGMMKETTNSVVMVFDLAP